MAPPDVIDVTSRPIHAAKRTPTLRRKKSFPKVKVNSSRSAQPIQGAARFLSATSGLCSGRHSYVLFLAPYLRTQRSPLDVVVTLWLQSTPPMLVRQGPWSSVSGLPTDKISEIDQPTGLVWLFFSIENESAVCASHLLLGSTGRHDIFV
ncbi:hypothetical protein MTR67_050961 [Solanum verrucosum]|uniref:Uncharacterized protein n=1 Tax=Solanum verrucosum TaxID=315347 RepID=A0AAF0V6A7_SOLVR|nr:hypothetical protein MTR67_050961 [Solanum verrucosum]